MMSWPTSRSVWPTSGEQRWISSGERRRNIRDLYKAYVTAVAEAAAAIEAAGDKAPKDLVLWPETLMDFLARRLIGLFTVRAFILDPDALKEPANGRAAPQALSPDALPLDGDPFKGLVKINEINAQRGLADEASPDELDGDGHRATPRLSSQLRSYYDRHLDPDKAVEASDLHAIVAIGAAERAFDERLVKMFAGPLSEVETLGYPGVTDPQLKISTRLRPTDGLAHESAVQYELATPSTSGAPAVLRLPEDRNGLGYRNLISMVFRLMSFRDAWMRVGKAAKAAVEVAVEPLHLVLVEEPEAHLHAQVQQVFIRKAYSVLRNHTDLGDSPALTTQLVVSTHSSHVAHETSFASLRYFRRMPAVEVNDVPFSTVVNLSSVFGSGDETARFVTRYLQARHCDLFFADAAILVEGPAERMLVPHFIRRPELHPLSQCYVTLLEIGGSHAHRLQPLIEALGLLTLVVTDLDAASASPHRAAARPARGSAQVTNNPTLRAWAPRLKEVDALLAADAAAKVVQSPGDPLFAVRVAYQTPIALVPADGGPAEALPNTFEDALAYENLAFFEEPSLGNAGLAREFRDAVTTYRADHDLAALGDAFFKALGKGRKAELALDVLYSASTAALEGLKVPTYIAEGLHWLMERLQVKNAETLGAVVGGAP